MLTVVVLYIHAGSALLVILMLASALEGLYLNIPPQSTISLSVISLFSLSFCSSMVNSPDILSEASHLRQGVPCSFAVEGLYHGGSHRVFKIVFEDTVQWTA